MQDLKTSANTELTCYHCGSKTKHPIIFDNHQFCCNGCKSVYSILLQNNLCQYYDFNENPGLSLQETNKLDTKFHFLDDQSVLQKLTLFKQNHEIHISFYLPQVHCSSCLYLLENLYKIHGGVISTKLNFSKKELTVIFNEDITSARAIANTLTQLGYEPYFSLSDLGGKQNSPKLSKDRLLRLGVAGFCFGNIMLLSFPEYFQWGTDLDGLKPFFQFAILLLTIPVITYSAVEFYKLAWGGLKEKYLNIDLPIVLAMFITLGRSLYEVFNHIGPGYFDSLSGIVFFMLLGRLLQDKTYRSITFDRDYTSYFPISVTVFDRGQEISKPIMEIKVNDELVIHDQEIIPVDGILAAGQATIDYSFVTGESVPVVLTAGSWIYAGGRQLGSSVRILSQKTVSQSYLVSLWNQQVKDNEGSSTRIESKYVQKASQWFTLGLFILASIAAIYWYNVDNTKIWSAVTAVLIVACPCALLLSVTFTHGHFLSLLAKNGFYLKGSKSLEKLKDIEQIVFDKTGTLTQSKNPRISYFGELMNDFELDAVAAVARESIHPHARKLAEFLDRARIGEVEINNIAGRGMEGKIHGMDIRIGSKEFLSVNDSILEDKIGSFMGVEIEGKFKGYYLLNSSFRSYLSELMKRLTPRFKLAVLSGDHASEKTVLEGIFPKGTVIAFEQKPHDKKEYIHALESTGIKTMMVGDGLNDAGALMESTFGLAVTDDVSYFSPGSDAVILGDKLGFLGSFILMAKKMRKIIWWSFAISIAYNLIGLFFAVRAELNPLIAAILMPASSITIVLFTWISSLISAKTLKLEI